MNAMKWMGTILLASATCIAAGCGGAPGDGVSTPAPFTQSADPRNPESKPDNGTSRGDGTGVPAADHDKVTNDNKDPNKDKQPSPDPKGPNHPQP